MQMNGFINEIILKKCRHYFSYKMLLIFLIFIGDNNDNDKKQLRIRENYAL